jgi:hypothetical protein
VKVVVAMIFLVTSSIAGGEFLDVYQRSRIVTWRIFGNQGINLTPKSQDCAEKLLYSLWVSSPLQIQKAAWCALNSVQDEITVVMKALKVKELQHISFTRGEAQKYFLLSAQERCLKNYCLGGHEIHPAGGAMLSLKEKELAALLIEYYKVQRQEIGTDFQKMHLFYVLQGKGLLPALLTLENDIHVYRVLLQGAHQMTPRPRLQMLSALVEFAVQMAVFTGESFTESLFSAEDKKQYDEISRSLKKMEENFQDFQKTIQAKSQAVIEAEAKAFAEQLEELQKKSSNVQDLVNQEMTYVMKTINLDVPRNKYLAPLDERVRYDHYFGASAMMVPGNYTWRNIFQGVYGDWEFDKESGTFIQRMLVPFGSPAQAINNAIFTEYVTSKRPYEIEVEITLIAVEMPFFAGIVFNKARWISGSLERMYAGRAVGLYGIQENNEPRIALTFGQSKITRADKLSVSTALDAMNEATSMLFSFPSAFASTIAQEQVTFIVTILNDMLTITVTLAQKTDQGRKSLYTGQITNLDVQQSKSLFLYHGIGLVSAGCQAAFKINQPYVVGSS